MKTKEASEQHNCVSRYMCLVDFNEAFDSNIYGVTIYPTIDALKNDHSITNCGIVEVEVKFKRIVSDNRI